MAIGTSDGKEYPSQLEMVLANLDSTGKNTIDQGRVDRNKDYDQFRDDNDLITVPNPIDVRRKIKVAQAGPDNKDTSTAEGWVDYSHTMPNIQSQDVPGSDLEWKKQVPPSYSGEITDSWHDIDTWRGKQIDPSALSPSDLREYLKEKGEAVPLQPAPLAPKEKNPRRPMTENDSIPPNARLTAADVGSPTLQAILDSFTNPNSDVPTPTKMAQAGLGISFGKKDDLNMNQQEKDLYQRHLDNLKGEGGVDNPDGSRSTLYAAQFGIDDKTYIIPTVRDGKVLSSDAALEAAKKEGLDKFPSYNTPEEADKRYAQMHQLMEKDTTDFLGKRDQDRAVQKFSDEVWFANRLSQSRQEEFAKTPRGKLMNILMLGMNALGPGRGGTPSPALSHARVDSILSGKDIGIRNTSDIHQAGKGAAVNDNFPDTAAFSDLRMSKQEMKEYLADKDRRVDTHNMSLQEIEDMTKKWETEGGPSAYDLAVTRQQAGKSSGDTAADFIKSVNRPSLSLVPKEPLRQTYLTKPTKGRVGKEENDNPEPGTPMHRTNGLVDENPSQEPQGRPIPGEQARTQEAQRAANDRNYAMGRDTERVDVGQGKGVLNNNRKDVLDMLDKGHRPSDIAKRYDITPLAVRNWIKRNGSANDLAAVLKRIKDNKE